MASGDVVHSVLEHDAALVGRDLDALLEREVASRLGAEAAAGLTPAAMARLRQLIERTRAHRSVARMVGGDAVERELPFTWFVEVDGAPSVLHGAMDLVARVEGMLEILDFKTHRIASGEEARTAAKYALQRDLYAAALHEVVGTPAAFRFFFPETSGEVVQAIDAGGVVEGRERVCGALREVARALDGRAS